MQLFTRTETRLLLRLLGHREPLRIDLYSSGDERVRMHEQ